MKEIKGEINVALNGELYEEMHNKLNNQLHWELRNMLDWELFDKIYNIYWELDTVLNNILEAI